MRIGIFDSGIGGLTVLAAARQAMPGHELVYLGDTARIPYGTRSPLTVVRYSLAVASHLVQHERVEALVVACNTASTHALPALQAACQALDIPVFGVVEPGVEAALEAHTGGAVAVLGTAGTVGGVRTSGRPGRTGAHAGGARRPLPALRAAGGGGAGCTATCPGRWPRPTWASSATAPPP
ncbi:MAG: aspartate/glutamate racemase family protein [Alphaproteobacteria bacterium]|nr:aspartate/glutamate racemase family protein [Alphaproteobacteria bacterium]